jgi:two-component system chemotaxis response regulator CheY
VGKRALVADQSPVMRQVFLRSLAAYGVVDTVEAEDGEQAIRQFQQQNFDLVLTDWNLPGKSGYELLQAVRQAKPQVPVIMVTSEAEKSRVVQAIQAGVSDYLVKPFTADALLEKLQKHCA